MLYYSSYGHVEQMAQAVADGARSVVGADVTIKRVPKLVPEATARKAGMKVDPPAPLATVQELAGYDAIIFGTPTRFGGMAAQMRSFLDQTGPLWVRSRRQGRKRVCLDSDAAPRPGDDADVISFHTHASWNDRRRTAVFVPRTDADGRDHRHLHAKQAQFP